jgi:hypothetical protein
MRTSIWLAAAALCLGAGSSAMAGTFNWNPFAPSNGVTFNGFSPPSNGVNYTAFGSSSTLPTGASTATFASPGGSQAGPSRLFNLLPGLHSLSNTHIIGTSIFPSNTDDYLAQFGMQRLK